MKMFITAILISLGLSSTCVFAIHSKATANNESRNMAFITQLYKDFFEKKNFDQMGKYLSKDVAFYKDFGQPVNYNALRKHLIEQKEQCAKLNILPFDDMLASGNKVVTLYTQNCTDKFNKIHKKRIMAITEINNLRRVSKIWVVTHEEKEST